jgi:hypothetical protein
MFYAQETSSFRKNTATNPKKQLQHERLWTNNCESMNHVFKRAVDWKPQPLLELVRSLNDVVRMHFIDLKLDGRVASGKTLSKALVRPLSSSLPILKSTFFTVS